MNDKKYQQYIMTELKSEHGSEDGAKGSEFVRIFRMDDKNTPGAFQMDCSWYLRPPKKQLTSFHHHSTAEILGFFGSDPENPHDLGGEIEFWLEDEKFIITKSTMIFVPAGMKHCPLIFKKVDRPIFHYSTVTSGTREILDQTPVVLQENSRSHSGKSKHSQFVVSDLHVPPEMDPNMIKKMEEWNHLILWVDSQVVPGSFQMNCCWFDKAPGEQPYFEHRHDVPEIIALIGSDPLKPRNMNGEVEFWMEGEKFIINNSCLIFVPPGMKHCPLYIKRVDKPIFHFSLVTSPQYTQLK